MYKTGSRVYIDHLGNVLSGKDATDACQRDKQTLAGQKARRHRQGKIGVRGPATPFKLQSQFDSKCNNNSNNNSSNNSSTNRDLSLSGLLHAHFSASNASLDFAQRSTLCTLAEMYSGGQHNSIFQLYPWQYDCLCLPGILNGTKNLVYTAPTSGGKTLVSEIIMLSHIVRQSPQSPNKVLVVMPYVSLVAEKSKFLQQKLLRGGVVVRGYHGGVSDGSHVLPSTVDVAICTIEKANTIVNQLMKDKRIPELSLVVVDEVHMISDPSRGVLIEIVLTKLRAIAPQVQIVCMTATLPSCAKLAGWLDATLYQSQRRPVPLKEYLVYPEIAKRRTTQYTKHLTVKLSQPTVSAAAQVDAEPTLVECKERSRQLHQVENLGKVPDFDCISHLCAEPIAVHGCNSTDSRSVLVFCYSKSAVQSAARLISDMLLHSKQKFHCDYRKNIASLRSQRQQLAHDIKQLTNPHQRYQRRHQQSQSDSTSNADSLENILLQCVKVGVAFHHAGMSVALRQRIERAFREGHVHILVATSTVATGVNLPVFRVILRTELLKPVSNSGATKLDGTLYRQMSGRAGRAGSSHSGECFLIFSDTAKRCYQSDKVRHSEYAKRALEWKKLQHQFLSTMYPLPKELRSALDTASSAHSAVSPAARMLSELVTAGVVSGRDDAAFFFKKSMWYHLRQEPGSGPPSQSQPQSQSDMKQLPNMITTLIDQCMTQLNQQHGEFIRVDGDSKLRATELARATFQGSMNPVDARNLWKELSEMRTTRVDISDKLLSHCYVIARRVNTVDLYENATANAATRYSEEPQPSGSTSDSTSSSTPLAKLIAKVGRGRDESSLRRQISAEILHDLSYDDSEKGKSLAEIAANHSVRSVSSVQLLRDMAVTECAVVVQFCTSLNHNGTARLFKLVQQNLLHRGEVPEKLLPLMEIKGMSRNDAHKLFDANVCDVQTLSKTDVGEIARYLRPAIDLSLTASTQCKLEAEHIKSHAQQLKENAVQSMRAEAALYFKKRRQPEDSNIDVAIAAVASATGCNRSSLI
jgi:replicative superfamily II helicase